VGVILERFLDRPRCPELPIPCRPHFVPPPRANVPAPPIAQATDLGVGVGVLRAQQRVCLRLDDGEGVHELGRRSSADPSAALKAAAGAPVAKSAVACASCWSASSQAPRAVVAGSRFARQRAHRCPMDAPTVTFDKGSLRDAAGGAECLIGHSQRWVLGSIMGHRCPGIGLCSEVGTVAQRSLG
jgi:hypothetical protein